MDGNFSKADWEASRSQMANMDPDAMKAQAKMMRNMSKDTLRATNPQFAGMSDAEIDMAAKQMEMMASNPAMMKMAMAQMGGMDHGQAQRAMKQAHAQRRGKKAAKLSDGYAVGDRVELKGLKGAAEHNGKLGTVTGSQGERLKVLLDGGDAKTLALKAANLIKQKVENAGAVSGLSLDALPDIDASQMKQATEAMKNADPGQMKAQAAAMRNMNPAEVRRMNPQMAGMSDAQITAAADQMEMMAENPDMMKMAMDQMESMSPEVLEQQMKMVQGMSPEDRAKMQAAAEGMMGGGGGFPGAPGGAGPVPADAAAASELLSNISEEQMGSMVDMVKKNPDMIKKMMKANPMTAGMDEAQLDAQLDMLNKVDPATMKKMIGVGKKLHTVCAPLVKLYSKCNAAVGGKLFQILGAALCAVIVAKVGSWVGLFGAAAVPEAVIDPLKAAAETVGAAVAGNEDDEFDLGS